MAIFEGVYNDGTDDTVLPIALNVDGHVITTITGLTTSDVAALSTQFPAALTTGGNLKTALQEVKPGTPTTTSVASSATSVTILASNASRRKVIVSNDSSAVLRLSFSTPATTANTFTQLASKATAIFDVAEIGTGAIYGIWESANGTAQVTESV